MVEASFGDWLKRRRLGLGLTQDQLAQQLHCSTSALRKFESEERHPSVEIVEQLAELFNIPAEERKSFGRFARGDSQAYAGEPEAKPWRRSGPARPSNLPSSLTSFIGREQEQSEIISLLKKNRLLTLAGPGGIGKTRLALELGHQLVHAYRNGVWFVPLESLSDPVRLPQTVASVFGAQEVHDRPIAEALIHVLGEKYALLILDNCEHLLDACATLVRTLLTRCPNVRILATTREVLNIEGEATYFLRSLSTSIEGDSLEEASARESTRLFVDRATLALSAFRITPESAPAIAEICRLLDGIPLAIELVAARVNILSIEELAGELHRSLAIVETRDRAAVSRHRTLRASLDWSWSLLTLAEQAFMRQLAVFAGGWTLESAQAVCEGSALDLTSSLAQKSLIAVEQGSSRATRYRFHAFLHQYAQQKLIEAGGLEAVSLRHLKYFLSLSEEIEAGLRGINQEHWHCRAADEWDNLNTALEAASQKDVEAGLYLSGRLQDVWRMKDIHLGLCWLEEFLRRPESDAYPLARARALRTQGWILLWLEKQTEARGPAEESLALYRARRDQTGEIDALNLLGATHYYIGHHAEAMRMYNEALILAHSRGDIWRQAVAYSFLGHVPSNFHRAVDYLSKAVELFAAAGDRSAQAEFLGEMGRIRAQNGDMEIAQKCVDEAATLIPLERNAYAWANSQLTRSLIARSQGDYETAGLRIQEALTHFEELGHQLLGRWFATFLGSIALAKGDIGAARKIFVESAQAWGKNDDPLGVTFALEEMARVLAITGNHKIAARLIGWTDAMREEMGYRRPRIEQRDINKARAVCIDALEEAGFSDEYREGRTMILKEAVELASNG